ncbi:MAG: hypothetical protein GY847_25490 [Proteobacteria bacterium]|nr:hypothetical protein [Pseudomonadota bacterium]
MKALAPAALLGLVVCFMSSCLPEATEEETNQMCDRLIELRGVIDIVTISDAITVVEKDYKEKSEQVLEHQKSTIEGLEIERDESLTNAKNDDQKKQINEDFEKNKQAVIKKYTLRLNALEPTKQTSIEKAKDKAAASNAEQEQAVQTCAKQSKAEGTSQKKAKCRIEATSLDQYWNACR